MEEIVKVYGVQVNTTTSDLLDEATALTAASYFIENPDELPPYERCKKMFFTLKVPLSRLKTLYSKIVEVRDMMERIVLEKAKIQFEVKEPTTDPETGEQTWNIIQPDIYCSSPETVEELKQTALQVISNDDRISLQIFEGDINDLVTGLYAVIDKIILFSNPTKDATFEWWKQQVIEANSQPE